METILKYDWNAIFIAILLGVIPGYIAYRKGHSFVSYWAFGALLFIVALPVSIFMKSDQEEIEARRARRGSTRMAPANAPQFEEQLNKLQALRNSGALSQAEYESAKERMSRSSTSV